MQEFVLRWFEELWLHYPLHPTTHGEVPLGEWDLRPPEKVPCFRESLGTGSKRVRMSHHRGELPEHSIQNPPRLVMLMEGSPST